MKKLTLLSFFLGSIFCTPLLFAGVRPAPIDFAFEKNIIIPTGSTGQEISVPLDTEILNNVDERFGNFGIYSKENELIPYSLFYENFNRVKTAKILDISSAKRGKVADMLDDNQLTAFQFDERVDQNEASWVLIDLGTLKPLNRADIFVPQGAQINYMEIEAGDTLENMNSLVSKRSFQWRSEFSSDPVQFVKVSFWGVNVRIADILFTSSRNGTAYFVAPEEGSVKILYGGTKADYLSFEARLSEEKESAAVAHLSRQKWNPIFMEDYDKDGIANEEDNCPFDENKGQKDSDKDRVGDTCDNAPKTRNITQSDLDGDSVGDIDDNCKLVKNKGQEDRDKDGFGDACDTAHAEDTSVDTSIIGKTTPAILAVGNKNISVFAGGILLALFVGIGIFQWRKKKKNRK
jgi:hypothetical protein